MRAYIIRRLIYTVIIAWGVLTVTFLLIQMSPNSPADKYLASMSVRGNDPSQVIASIEARYGVNRPVWEKYSEYIVNLARGDWGWSFGTSMPVAELIKRHWIYSFQLVLLSSVLAAIFGILIGVYSAVRQYTKVDYIATFFSFVGISMPGFWLGLMLILIFSVQLGWFKSYYDTNLPILSFENLKALTLPVLTMAIGGMAGYTRYTRSSVLDNLRKDFVRTARAKGLSEKRVIGKHVLRNAMLPIVTIMMFDLGSVVFGGAYMAEIIFGIPGLGRISFNAVMASDYPVVITIVLISALIILLVNLVTDIMYTWLDPRVRYT